MFVKGRQKLPNSGRTKGTPNKATAPLKEMIYDTLIELGGIDYLKKLALDNPTAFATLIKAILPKDVNIGGQKDNEFIVKILGFNPNGN